MKIVFFGNTTFSTAILKHLHAKGFNVVGVVTNPDKARFRSSKLLPSCVKQWAMDMMPGVSLLQPEKLRDLAFKEALADLNGDLFIVVAYGKILPESVLNMAKVDCINVHASLLPKYRGASPIEASLINGDTVTGVSIMRMVKAMDAGPVFEKEEVTITSEMSKADLIAALEEAGSRTLEGVIHRLEKGGLEPTTQDDSKASYVKKILPKDTKINWHESATSIFNKVRAYGPRPGAWMEVEIAGAVKRVKVLSCRAVECAGATPKANMSLSKLEWVIGADVGGVSILELQVQGKKPLDIKTFLAGCQKQIIVI